MNRIAEKDYLHHNTRQLQRLARDLQDTGLSISEISRQTSLNWDTVYKALNRRPVRFDSAERLRYFCQRWQQEHRQQPRDGRPATPARGKGGRFLPKNPKQ